jgi:hypothetical protein
MSLRLSALAVVLCAGCMAGNVDEPQTSNVRQLVGGPDDGTCDEFMCGTNSPQIAEFGFWELNLPTDLKPSLPNNVGMQVIGFLKDGKLYLPAVSEGRLTATRNTITLAGSELVGGGLYLANGKRSFLLKITEVGSVASWAQSSSGPPVVLESYKLDWTALVNGAETEFYNMCPHPPTRDDTMGMTGPLAFHTLLFEGDRIDARQKLDTDVDVSWVNLGCAGSALAKLALTGHTEASLNAKAFKTTLAERQTMLKMLTADYCGDGTPFTVPGQPLNWRDDAGTMQLTALITQPPQPLALEARWTEKGAACLDSPRVDVHWTDLGDEVFGANVYQQVKDHCAGSMPPPCADGSFDLDGYHLLTATVPYHP